MLLKLSEVSDRLRISRASVSRLVHRGVLPVILLGGERRRLLRVDESALDAFLRARTSVAEAEVHS